jgi:hypothetical protein
MEHPREFKQWWFNLHHAQYCLLNNMVLLVNIDHFEPNPMLVNANKVKPYYLFDDNTKGFIIKLKGGRRNGW